MKLPVLICPNCGKEMSYKEGRPETARKYESCIRRCESCGIGYSNTFPTLIYRHPIQNIPCEVQSYAKDVVDKALNEANCKNNKKWERFGFSTSEDALTWTFFVWLQNEGMIRKVLSPAGINGLQKIGEEPDMLLWGAPVPPLQDSRDSNIRREIEDISDKIGERKDYRSEPDVVLDFPEKLVVIEVNYLSGNRRIGNELAEGLNKPFVLVNLVMRKKSNNKDNESVQKF